MAVDIVATKNGPYLVTADLSQLELRDGDGGVFRVHGGGLSVVLMTGRSTGARLSSMRRWHERAIFRSDTRHQFGHSGAARRLGDEGGSGLQGR